MNIVVCIPKKELKNIKEEDEFSQDKNVIQYWKIGRKPKYLEIGDKVYFSEDGKIKYFHYFSGFKENIYCEVTGRIWQGLNLVLQYPEIKLEEEIEMKGFRGFRYLKGEIRYEIFK